MKLGPYVELQFLPKPGTDLPPFFIRIYVYPTAIAVCAALWALATVLR